MQMQTQMPNMQSPMQNMYSPTQNMQTMQGTQSVQMPNMQTPIQGMQTPMPNMQPQDVEKILRSIQPPLSNIPQLLKELQTPMPGAQSPTQTRHVPGEGTQMYVVKKESKPAKTTGKPEESRKPEADGKQAKVSQETIENIKAPAQEKAVDENTKAQTEITKAQPESSKVQPEIIKPQPESSKVQPEIIKPQPESSKVQPEITKPQPDSRSDIRYRQMPVQRWYVTRRTSEDSAEKEKGTAQIPVKEKEAADQIQAPEEIKIETAEIQTPAEIKQETAEIRETEGLKEESAESETTAEAKAPQESTPEIVQQEALVPAEQQALSIPETVGSYISNSFKDKENAIQPISNFITDPSNAEYVQALQGLVAKDMGGILGIFGMHYKMGDFRHPDDPSGDIWYSTKNGIQHLFGFQDTYNFLETLIGFNLKTETVLFSAEDELYRFQVWYGLYSMTILVPGTESGLYCKDNLKSGHFKAVPVERQIGMEVELYNRLGDKIIFAVDSANTEADGITYWQFGSKFSAGQIDVGNLYMKGKLKSPDQNFLAALVKAGKKSAIIFEEPVLDPDTDKYTVAYKYDVSGSKQN